MTLPLDNLTKNEPMRPIRHLLAAVIAALTLAGVSASAEQRPNILFCISDDQSWAYTGANGDPIVKTPAFDRISA